MTATNPAMFAVASLEVELRLCSTHRAVEGWAKPKPSLIHTSLTHTSLTHTSLTHTSLIHTSLTHTSLTHNSGASHCRALPG
ncbi:MAG: hypothetical protein HC780_06935 [Leptolyngbyaceae cyanobacterium CSU_1_3]|nr:hypothetical protein [Leptolyngbyaceae cyanobacterium CSU_1_3]